jgi:hypothetical protein
MQGSPNRRLRASLCLRPLAGHRLPDAAGLRLRPRGRMTTLGEYLEAVAVATRDRHGLRRGQTFFNVLSELEPELAGRVIGTADDPFYNDGKLPGFLLRVAEALR